MVIRVTWTDGLDLAVIEDGSNGLVEDMLVDITAVAGTTESGDGWIETARELVEDVEEEHVSEMNLNSGLRINKPWLQNIIRKYWVVLVVSDIPNK